MPYCDFLQRDCATNKHFDRVANRDSWWHSQHRGQTFAHVRVVVRAELSARTKTEEKYISGRLHKAVEKRVNKITRG